MGFLKSIGQWLLKIFLGGIFDGQNQQVIDEAQQKTDAAAAHDQSVTESSQEEVDILKEEERIKEEYAKQNGTPDDPFGSGKWNGEK